MINWQLLRPANLLIIGVIALIWTLTIGKFFSSHVEKDNSK
jgi:hypothetical protein